MHLLTVFLLMPVLLSAQGRAPGMQGRGAGPMGGQAQVQMQGQGGRGAGQMGRGGTGDAGAPATAPPQNVRQYLPEELCVIQGQVLNAATGEPIRKASVQLAPLAGGPGGGRGYATTTGDSGAFTISGVVPGNYRMLMSRTGFVTAIYGADEPGRAGVPFTLDPGKKLTGIVFRASPQGAVSGRVVDENGDPVAYAQVRLLRYQYSRGRKQLVASGGSASTNDLGEYRVFGVNPGKYYVSAIYRQPRAPLPMGGRGGMMAQEAAGAYLSPSEDYVPVYFPGTTDAAAAAAIQVGAGSQVPNINLQLVTMRTVRVSGRTTPGASVSLIPRYALNPADLRRSASADREGNFRIAGVLPGSYYLVATAMQSRQAYSSRQALDVGGSDVDGLSLTPSPGVQVSGRVRTEDAQPLPAGAMRVSLTPRDDFPTGTTPEGARVAEDGAFRMDAVSINHYDVNVVNMPAGFYLKSVRAGGSDVLQTGFELSGGASVLDIVISPSPAQITGTVTPAQPASVVLIPQDTERRARYSNYRAARSDENGAFNFNTLPPGRYAVFAFEEVEAGAYMDPEFMKPYENSGQSVAVGEKETATVQLRLIPRAR